MTLTAQTTNYVLDISRLLARAGQNVPTGIDRVELAYAQYLLSSPSSRVFFVGMSVTGWMGNLPRKQVSQLINMLVRGWNHGERNSLPKAQKIARYLKCFLLLGRPLPQLSEHSVYLLLSHHHLARLNIIKNFIEQTKTLFVPMLHDLIPIEYPEYARPREPARHEARLRTVITLADAVIVPTQTVNNSLRQHFIAASRKDVPIWTVHHGVHSQVLQRETNNFSLKQKGKPFFVYLSTIEPRKNHLLLLHLWRRMVEQRGKDATPCLVLVGKRGWENENILDMLERCPALQDIVLEKNHLSDEEVTDLLKNASGLLFPSFSEGYGLPLTEAMSLGLPCICSDIPVLREVGGNIPFYIDPLDSMNWQKAIDDFAQQGSLWQLQKQKLENFHPVPWEESISAALLQCRNL